MNKATTFLKKHLAIGVLIVAMAALGLSNYRLQDKFNNGSNKVLSFEENTEDMTDGGMPLFDGVNLGNFEAIPHLYCAAQVQHETLPTSTEYNPNFVYPTYFMGSGTHFQDLNGDSLVDYIWNYVNLGGNNSETESTYQSCVYLNNGNSWTRASICNASTRVNHNTGQIINAEYRGDCAGEPSAQKQSKDE